MPSFLDKVLGRSNPSTNKPAGGTVGVPSVALAGVVQPQARPVDEWTATSARPVPQQRPAGYLGPAAPAQGGAYVVPEAPAQAQQGAPAPAVLPLNANPPHSSDTSKRSSGVMMFSLESILRFARRTTDRSHRGTEERTKESPRRSWHGGIFSSMSSPRATPPPR